MELVSKLAVSGRLKPEVRLGLAISEFAKVLDSEHRKEFRSMQAMKSAQISGRDVIKVTEEINQEGARRHRSWRPHGTKVGGFLSRIQTLASIGDVLIAGSQNLIATGVWSAVRLSLTIATNYLTYFEKLSVLFMRLGTSWALHEDFAQVFPRSEVLQTYFCEYLVVLMKLCKKVVLFSQMNIGAQLFSSLGSSFDSEFGAIQKELDQWGCLIQQQTQLLTTKLATDAQGGRFYDLKQRLLRQLSPYQYDVETRWRRQRKKGTCEWIFNTPNFQDWKSMPTSATLSISGKLGSGKTVSMANIVARMDLDQPCAYAFCASQESTSLKANHILGTIAHNLLDNLPTEAVAWRRVEQNDRTAAFDPDSIIDILLDLLPEDRVYIIIVDGLEDSPDADSIDVILGLRRLLQNRFVLLCYSSRSDSRFQHIAEQHLSPEFSISHDESKHDEELESYIVEKVARRNATRHLSSDLEALVKKQLIAGAQGMYLWVSLQLDTIFPANSKVVITDDQILNLITRLPRDLPEAFERALEGILDRQYEGRIMKLVMSAVTPLSLDEIRVALCVILGEPVWHPEKIAKDGMQLMTLCGGNLLELDEEDGKVRFIHHSVMQHLLSPAASQSTSSYHFTQEDAQNFIGATCVTYLHLSVLDSRLTVTRNLQSLDVLENVVETTQTASPLVSLLVQHIRSRKQKQDRPSQIDIGHIITQIQASRIQDDLDPRCFADYAMEHWVFHTRFFDDEIEDCKKSWRLWWRLLHGGVPIIKPPFPDLREDPYATLLWAVDQAHGSLFRNVINGAHLRSSQIIELLTILERRKSIRGKWLGSTLAQYLQSLHTIRMPSTAKRIILLLHLGADPKVLHPISKAEPINILVDRIANDALLVEDEQELARAVFSHSAFHKCFEDWEVIQILEKLLGSAKIGAFCEIVACRPDLNFESDRKKGNPLRPKPHIGVALHNGIWEQREALPGARLVNTPTSSGKTLLWKAIETMNDACVYQLLSLGANPNAGPFTMEKRFNSPNFASECYPLEAALWLRRTRICLELLHRGANLDQLGDSPIEIARETGNLILVARLHEMSAWSRCKERNGGQRRYEQGRTALTTACRMLSHDSSNDRSCPIGFARPLNNDDFAWNWRSELDKIIYRLALHEDTEYVNARDEGGETALHHVSKARNTSSSSFQTLVNVLLDRGADPNLPDRHGETPLCLAIRNSTPVDSMIKPLLKAGADLNAVCPLHRVSMLRTAMNRDLSPDGDVTRLVRLLLQFGADPRSPLEPKSPDPFLIALGFRIGAEDLAEDFVKYTNRLNKRGIEENNESK